MAGTEGISALNSLFFLDYSYLNGLLKKRGRTRDENEAFLRLFRSELMRVNEAFHNHLNVLVRVQESATTEKELLLSVWQRCVHLEDFVNLNRKAALRVADRFDWLVSGSQASHLMRELDLDWNNSELPHIKEWAETKLLELYSLPASDISLRRPGDAMGWTGFFGGCCVSLFVMLVVLLSTQDAISSPFWMPAHRVFRMFLLLSIYILLMGIDVFVWSIVPVDWAFVFNIDQTRYLRARHYILAGFQLGTITLGFANAFLLHIRWNPLDTRADYWLVAVFAVQFCFLFNPFPFGHRRARMWLLRTLLRIMGAPFVGPVQFRDFWLADQFCSMVILITDVGYTGCYFILDLGRGTDKCTAQVVPWLRPLLACLPFWFRLMQCLRRYYDLRVYRDLLNAGKYFLSITLVVFATLHSTLDIDTWGTFRILWIVNAVLATLSAFTWDVLLDWGIGRIHFRLLRRNLVFPKWCYYLAMPLNLVLRCAWLFTVAPSPFVGYVYEKALEFSLAGAEIFRRAHWNLYRLANEQTALMTQLKYVDKMQDVIPVDTYERAPKRGRSTNKMQPFISDVNDFSHDDVPSTTDDEQ